MRLPSPLTGALFALFSLPLLAAADPALTVTADNPTGIAAPGQKIVWHVAVSDDPEHKIQNGTYVLKKGGAEVIGQGKLTFGAEPATVETSLNGPGTVLAEFDAPVEGKKPLQAFAGAAVEPGKLRPSLPAPADFDAFWKAKIAELTAVPENAVLEKSDSGKEGIDYWKITMDNIRGTHIHGQVARPAAGEKHPALLIVQWAGVYPLPKTFVTDRAQEGWLVLNILAHDLPIDNPKEFYDEQGKNALKDYTSIGNEDRETSYFLRMFLSCYRAAEYLSKRPDWDGKTLIVSGGSQGGLQSFVTAALNPKITAVLANVPAGCDNTGAEAGRNPGWPYWKNHTQGRDAKKVMETSRYFDAMNFAARIHCPTLVGMGLIDVTSPASGVFSAFNQIKAPKEIVVIPNSPHQNVNGVQGPFYKREGEWRAALVKGQPAPVQPNTAVAP
ncbi:MAG: acetylxylan esterase [Chthoniobacteraceae bacterium]|nr:acetylxylan esterase [Chthoniobacteraceae bacterium]